MIPDKIQAVLSRHSLKAVEFEEGSTPTAETAAIKLQVQTGQIAKSILLKGKDGRFFMMVCAGDRRIDSKKVKALTGTNTRMAQPEELKDQTGFNPGEVCPFGVTGPEIFLDISLKRFDTIYPGGAGDL